MLGSIFECVCEGQDVLTAVSEMNQETNLVTLGTESIAKRKQVDPLSFCFLHVTLVERQEVKLGEAARLLQAPRPSSSVGGSRVSPVFCKLGG